MADRFKSIIGYIWVLLLLGGPIAKLVARATGKDAWGYAGDSISLLKELLVFSSTNLLAIFRGKAKSLLVVDTTLAKVMGPLLFFGVFVTLVCLGFIYELKDLK